MTNRKELVGAKFHSWTVIASAEKAKGTHARWLCRCDCGAEKIVYQCHLISGASKSCSRSGHNQTPKSTPGYKSWEAMRARCENEGHMHFKRYGGRGVVVCARWQKFENFIADMGARPSPAHSIDRYPNKDGNYEPGNCRWATPVEQQNNLRSNRIIEWGGERLTIAQASRASGINYNTLYSRLQRSGVI